MGNKTVKKLSKQEQKVKEVRRNLNTLCSAENGMVVLTRECAKKNINVPTTDDVGLNHLAQSLETTRIAVSKLGLH